MDKSFNDQELSDIMKEIEALEEDFATTEEKKMETASPVLEELAEMDEKVSVPVAEASAHVEEVEEEEAAEVVALETKRPAAYEAPVASTSAPHTSMSFKVQGNLTLELQFDVGGKVVSLEVSETGLSIEMEGGMKFTVPMTEKASWKKAV